VISRHIAANNIDYFFFFAELCSRFALVWKWEAQFVFYKTM